MILLTVMMCFACDFIVMFVSTDNKIMCDEYRSTHAIDCVV